MYLCIIYNIQNISFWYPYNKFNTVLVIDILTNILMIYIYLCNIYNIQNISFWYPYNKSNTVLVIDIIIHEVSKPEL